MYRIISFLSILAGVFVLCGCNGEQLSVVKPGAEVVKLAGDFKFTEGPAVDSEGNIYFTDIPNNRIHKWSVDGKLSTFRENSGGANGLYFDKDGNMLACEGNTGRLVSIDVSGNVKVLAETFGGKKFNSPNDLWITPKGGVYFTDPRYGNRDNLPQDGEHVYYLAAGSSEAVRVINNMVQPNGVIGTGDGKKLYVADLGAGQTFVYNIKPDGQLGEGKLFAMDGSDGMTIDNEGNIYLTTNVVAVYNHAGEMIEAIEIPERPSNVTFGGKDKKTLFVTARSGLYSIRMRVKGL